MWQIKWLRRFVRRHTNPIPRQEALGWKQKFSIMYAILAWNAFGMVCYMVYSGRRDWAKYYGYKSEADDMLSPGRQWAKTFNIENAKIVRISGLHMMTEEQYNEEKRSMSNPDSDDVKENLTT